MSRSGNREGWQSPAANEGERWGQFTAGLFFIRIRCDPDKKKPISRGGRKVVREFLISSRKLP
jgi:hypothetical protein